MDAKRHAVWLSVLLALTAIATGLAYAAPPVSDEARFVSWAKQSLIPLSTVQAGSSWEDLVPFGKMIGDATVVAFSEANHDGVEPLELRNRLLRYLVQEKSFTAIAIESGIVEGRTVHDYVRGGSEDLPTAMTQGFSWGFDGMPQNQALVRWLKEYNADPRHTRKVNFYGFDIPGSPGNAGVRRSVDTALLEALKYLASVDSTSAAVFRARLGALLTNLRFDTFRSADAPGYDRLNQVERNELTVAVNDLITLLERKEAQYTAATTAGDYEWGYRAAIGARQIDAWLRQIPLGWKPVSRSMKFPNEETRFYAPATDVRDRGQADNLEWILRQEGPRGKVLVFAHRYHLSKTAVNASFFVPGGSLQQPAGTYLQRRLGDRLVTIGNLAGKGEVGCAAPKRILEAAAPHSIEGLAEHTAVPLFVLDLRAAPAAVANWLNQEHTLAQTNETLRVGKAFDVLFYVSTMTACGSASR